MKIGDYAHALEAAYRIDSRSTRWSTATEVCIAMFRQGDEAKAREVLERIEDSELYTKALAAYTTYLARQGRCEEARQTLREVLAQIEPGPFGFEIDEEIAVAITELSRYPGQENTLLFQEIVSAWERTYINVWERAYDLKNIRCALARVGELSLALAGLDRLDIHARSGLLRDIASIMAAQGDKYTARRFFAEAIQLARHNDEDRDSRLFYLAERLADAGKTLRAVRLVQECRNLDQEGQIRNLPHLVIALLKQGERQLAKPLFAKLLVLAANSGDLYALAHSVATLSNAGEMDKARQIWQHLYTKVQEAWANVGREKRVCYTHLETLAEISAQIGEHAMFMQFLERNPLGGQYRSYTIVAWEKALLKYVADPVPALKHALALYPFDPFLTYYGLHMLQLAHFQKGEQEQYARIRDFLMQPEVTVLFLEGKMGRI
jgi:tetratricopeptide (TPR) repeat protein